LIVQGVGVVQFINRFTRAMQVKFHEAALSAVAGYLEIFFQMPLIDNEA